jgi:hypothetical protein
MRSASVFRTSGELFVTEASLIRMFEQWGSLFFLFALLTWEACDLPASHCAFLPLRLVFLRAAS